jgi:hypothetical protein
MNIKNLNKFFHFHHDHSNDNEECHAIKKDRKLISRGYLQQFISKINTTQIRKETFPRCITEDKKILEIYLNYLLNFLIEVIIFLYVSKQVSYL